MNKNSKKKGYILAIVMILAFVMAITAVSTFTIIFRYMTHAKENMGDVHKVLNYQVEEVYSDARI